MQARETESKNYEDLAIQAAFNSEWIKPKMEWY